LTPAAATAIRTSPAPGSGIGRVVGCNTSGPPGPVISIAVIVVGNWLIGNSCLEGGVSVAPLARTRETGNRLRGAERREAAMFEDEDLAAQKTPPKKKDLTPLSLAELDAYIAAMEAEIARVRAEIAAKRKQRGGAESLFKR